MARKRDTGDQAPTRTKDQASTRTKTTHQRNTDQDGEGSELLPNLPHEIVVEILYRVPVRSLLRFRCVCKTWRSLISDPQFVKTHLNISSKNDNYAQCSSSSSSRIILNLKRPENYDLKSCSLYSALYGPSVDTIDLDYPLKHPENFVWIIGSCNGLLCISVGFNALIWNPSTRKSKKLPSSGMRLSMAFLEVYGFGYDQFTDDYKLLVVYDYHTQLGGSNEIETKVYASRTDSWRRIQDFPCGFPLRKSGIFLNRSLHWEAPCKIASSSTRLVCSMDLANETYGEVPQPNYGDGDYSLTLGVLEGCLCVLCDFRGTRADVWVMKEYGVRDSWSKLVSIPYLTRWMIKYPPPLYISKNGEILLMYGERLEICNPKHGTFRYPMIHNFVACRQACTYIESLVSPSADYVDERQVQ